MKAKEFACHDKLKVFMLYGGLRAPEYGVLEGEVAKFLAKVGRIDVTIKSQCLRIDGEVHNAMVVVLSVVFTSPIPIVWPD